MNNRTPSKQHFSYWWTILATILLLAMMAGTAMGDDGIRIFVDGREINYGDSPPTIMNGRTCVGVASLALALGVPADGIKWDPATRTVTLTKDSTVMELTLDSTVMKVNGSPVVIDVAPISYNNRTYLPAGHVATHFGYTVVWDAGTKSVNMSKGGSSNSSNNNSSNSNNNSQTNDGKQYKYIITVDDTFDGNVSGEPITYTLKIEATHVGPDKFGQYDGTLYLKADMKVPEPAYGYMKYEYPAQNIIMFLDAYDSTKFANKIAGIQQGDPNANSALAPLVDYKGMVFFNRVLNGTYSYDIKMDTNPPQHQSDSRKDEADVDIIMGIQSNGAIDVNMFFIQDLKFFGLLSK